MRIRVCLHCGKEFVRPRNWPGTHEYCSVGCSNASRRKERKPRQCLQCGATFVPRHKEATQKYCSQKCWGRAQTSSPVVRRRRESQPEERIIIVKEPAWFDQVDAGYGF